MNQKELDFILQEGEGLKVEFKEGFSSLDKEIVALANTFGGRIFLGVDDGGKIKGIKIMEKICKEEKAPSPEIEVQENYFYVVFRPSKAYLELSEQVGETVGEKVGETVGERLTGNQLKILEEINRKKFISALKLSEIVGISQRKVEENIAKLKKKGLLKRIGPAKGGYWEIIKNQ